MLSNDCRRLVEWKRRVVRRQAASVQYGWIINDGSLARYSRSNRRRKSFEMVESARGGRRPSCSLPRPGKSVAPRRRIISFLVGGTERGGGS